VHDEVAGDVGVVGVMNANERIGLSRRNGQII